MSNVSSVFYAESYHPIQAGSIDGTDVHPHDNAIFRAHLCSSASLYDPFGDPNVLGDPHCTLFVARLSHQTTEQTLHEAMSKYGRVKNLRLVRHIVTGTSRGYAFVEFETQREMRRAYKDSHHSVIDGCEVIVDYNRQQLMPGWIPRRLGGGFGGKKESGQLRFGGRERPFRAPLRPIPYDELKKLGIQPPPEGKYMSRCQEPSPPRKEKCSDDREEEGYKRIRSTDSCGQRHHVKNSMEREERSNRRVSSEKGRDHTERSSMERDRSPSVSTERSEHYQKRKSRNEDDHSHKGRYKDRDEKHSHKRRKSSQHDRSYGTASEREDR